MPFRNKMNQKSGKEAVHLGKKIGAAVVNFFIRAFIGMALIFFINQYVLPPDSSINVGFYIRKSWNSGGRASLRDYVLSDFVRILQKTADFIFALDKMKSAVYNASYTADITCRIQHLREC